MYIIYKVNLANGQSSFPCCLQLE